VRLAGYSSNASGNALIMRAVFALVWTMRSMAMIKLPGSVNHAIGGVFIAGLLVPGDVVAVDEPAQGCAASRLFCGPVCFGTILHYDTGLWHRRGCNGALYLIRGNVTPR